MVGQSFEDLAQEFAKGKLRNDTLVRNVHLDLNSTEKITGVEKAKYKLLTKRFVDLGIYFFYALTTRESSCPQRAKVELGQNSFESKTGTHLSAPISYINLEKPIVEDAQSLINKIRKSANNFECVGRITQYALSEITQKAETVRTSILLDQNTRQTISHAFGIEDISDDFLKKYKI